MRLFHLVPRDQWRAFIESGADAWAPPSLASEGFVHLSFPDQLTGTLAAHFSAHSTVTLLEVFVEAAEELVIEASRGGADFPHLYRALRRSECLGHWHLTSMDGDWTVPAFGATPADDAPQSSTGVQQPHQ